LDCDDYNKYKDELSNYYKDGDYLLNKLTSLSEADYKAFLQEIDAFESDRDFEYKKYLEALEQQNFYDKLKFEQSKFDEEMAFKKSEPERDQRNADRSYSLSASRGSSSSSSSKNKSSSLGYKASIIPKTYEQFYYLTGYAGIYNKTEFLAREELIKKYGTYENYVTTMYMKYIGEKERS
jgi:hypothetical protein